jgi:virginiamycin A acetyltransferase
MRILIKPALLSLFERSRLFSSATGPSRWKERQILYFGVDTRIEPYTHILDGLSLPRQLGAFSYSYSALDPCFNIGRYCSIAAALLPMGSQHPIGWATQSPFSYQAAHLQAFESYYADNDAEQAPMLSFDGGPIGIEIGHDVWIGGGAMIKRGIEIGTGAVVAARAVVTHDVPPYAVVGGVPARILRYRFPEPVIESLLASRWWDYGPDVLQTLDVTDPAHWADRLADAVAAGAEPLAVTPLTAQAMIDAVTVQPAEQVA